MYIYMPYHFNISSHGIYWEQMACASGEHTLYHVGRWLYEFGRGRIPPVSL